MDSRKTPLKFLAKATVQRHASALIMKFAFGHTEHERIEVDVLSYERNPVGEFHDDNWLTVEIAVQAGGFRGRAQAAIFTYELAEFLPKLRSLHNSLSVVPVEFTTMEGQLRLVLTGDGLGHIELAGEVADQPGIGNRLHFTLHFDQSQLAISIGELEKVVSSYPVRQI